MERCKNKERVVLNYLNTNFNGPIMLSDVVKGTGYSKSAAHRYLTTLVDYGLVEHCKPFGYCVTEHAATVDTIPDLAKWFAGYVERDAAASALADKFAAERLVRRGKRHMAAAASNATWRPRIRTNPGGVGL